jgi:hypothetical protein
MNLSAEIWAGGILGAVLGAIVIPFVHYLIKILAKWWRETRPPLKLLEGIANQEEPCKIFVRDFIIPENTPLISIEPRVGVGTVPNVRELWPVVDGKGATSVFNVLGQVGKTQNIEIIHMSQDVGEWNCHVIVLGAQANKSYDFYRLMKNVAFQMDGDNIYDAVSGEIVEREDGFGYGIILKALNPFKETGNGGVGILIGGFGVLGTVAAAYYFKEHFRQLGKEFGNDCFGIVVRSPISAGEQAVERLKKWDRRYH